MNSLRSVNLKNFLADFLLTCNADIIGITELRGSIADIMSLHNFRKILRQAGYTYN